MVELLDEWWYFLDEHFGGKRCLCFRLDSSCREVLEDSLGNHVELENFFFLQLFLSWKFCWQKSSMQCGGTGIGGLIWDGMRSISFAFRSLLGLGILMVPSWFRFWLHEVEKRKLFSCTLANYWRIFILWLTLEIIKHHRGDFWEGGRERWPTLAGPHRVP